MTHYDQKLPNFQGHGHRDDAACNVFHRQFGHNKINHVPYQTIEYNDNGMFTTKLMNDTPIEILIDNGATPSILPLCTYNKFPILHTYSKTESNTPIHTGGGLITSHFGLKYH